MNMESEMSLAKVIQSVVLVYSDAEAIDPAKDNPLNGWRIRSGKPGFWLDLSVSDDGDHRNAEQAWRAAFKNIQNRLTTGQVEQSTPLSRATSLPPTDKKGVPVACPHCGIEALEYGGNKFEKHIERCGRAKKQMDLRVEEIKEQIKQMDLEQAEIEEDNWPPTNYVDLGNGHKVYESGEVKNDQIQTHECCGPADYQPDPFDCPEHKPTTLKSLQHGGSHYKKLKVEPAYYCHVNKLQFCEAEAIKYLTRFRDKNGIEDVKKAIHYCQMILDFEYGILSTVEFSEEKKEQNASESNSGERSAVEEVSSSQ